MQGLNNVNSERQTQLKKILNTILILTALGFSFPAKSFDLPKNFVCEAEFQLNWMAGTNGKDLRREGKYKFRISTPNINMHDGLPTGEVTTISLDLISTHTNEMFSFGEYEFVLVAVSADAEGKNQHATFMPYDKNLKISPSGYFDLHKPAWDNNGLWYFTRVSGHPNDVMAFGKCNPD